MISGVSFIPRAYYFAAIKRTMTLGQGTVAYDRNTNQDYSKFKNKNKDWWEINVAWLEGPIWWYFFGNRKSGVA